ncbi:MAG: major outer membrane protein [Arcobacteraceae bacterium]|nr:major outer membrane protein [Arcobacteraceae bacterium]
MTKFVKISLAAAVAVAGLNSVASAKPLEEAIKGVDATGYVTYQYNDQNDIASSSQSNIYKAGMVLTIPATDDIKVKLTGTVRGLTQDNSGDANPSTTLEHANFVYSGVNNLTVIAGKQALNTPWTQGSSNIDLTQSGTGVLAMYNAGFATIAAGHFVNNSIKNGNQAAGGTEAKVNITANDLTVAALIVPIAEVATAQVWYANVGKTSETSTLNQGADALSASIETKIMDLAKLNVTHSELKAKDYASNKKQKLTKATLSGKAGPVGLTAAYVKTGKDGGLVAFDSDGSAGFKGFSADLNGTQDAKAWLLSAKMDIMSNLNLALTHISADEKKTSSTTDDQDITETYGQLTYQFAKNLSAYVRYGVYEVENNVGTKTTDRDRGRLQISYKF